MTSLTIQPSPGIKDLIQQTFIEQLLCARHRSWCRDGHLDKTQALPLASVQSKNGQRTSARGLYYKADHGTCREKGTNKVLRWFSGGSGPSVGRAGRASWKTWFVHGPGRKQKRAFQEARTFQEMRTASPKAQRQENRAPLPGMASGAGCKGRRGLVGPPGRSARGLGRYSVARGTLKSVHGAGEEGRCACSGRTGEGASVPRSP